jgi:hypothetical protein
LILWIIRVRANTRRNLAMSAVTPISTKSATCRKRRFVPIATDAPQQTALLFNHLVGVREHGRQHGEVERFGSFELITSWYSVGICTGRVVFNYSRPSATGRFNFSPELLHRSKLPSSLHRKLRANSVTHDSKLWRRTWPS